MLTVGSKGRTPRWRAIKKHAEQLFEMRCERHRWGRCTTGGLVSKNKEKKKLKKKYFNSNAFEFLFKIVHFFIFLYGPSDFPGKTKDRVAKDSKKSPTNFSRKGELPLTTPPTAWETSPRARRTSWLPLVLVDQTSKGNFKMKFYRMTLLVISKWENERQREGEGVYLLGSIPTAWS